MHGRMKGKISIMAHKTYISRVLAAFQLRIAGLQAIDQNLDLGNSLSLQGLLQNYGLLQQSVTGYRLALADADAFRIQIKDLEAKARDLSERALAGVAARFGKNSVEYQKAGGKKKSERKRPGQLQKQKAARKSNKPGRTSPTLLGSEPEAPIVVTPSSE